MKVYVAGPYTIGDVALNVRKAIEIGDAIIMRGMTPYIPHLSHFWHLLSPKEYEFWLKFDLEWMYTCDAVFRFSGESKGADNEVHAAKEAGIPVFTVMQDLVAYKNERINPEVQ